MSEQTAKLFELAKIIESVFKDPKGHRLPYPQVALQVIEATEAAMSTCQATGQRSAPLCWLYRATNTEVIFKAKGVGEFQGYVVSGQTIFLNNYS